MKVYVVVDIGCIHCSEDTRILLITQDEGRARELATGSYYGRGEHSVEVLESEVEA